MTRKFKGIGLGVLLAATTALAACGSGGAGGGDVIRIAVGVDAGYAPFYVADAEGMFEDAGLNVEIVQFARGGEGIDALGAGEVQLAGNSDTTTSAQMASNGDLRALLSYESSDQYIKAVLRNEVSSVNDVKKVGVVEGLSHLATDYYLEANGLSLDSVEVVKATPADMPALMARGDIDAYVMWEPWPGMAVDQGIGRIDAKSEEFGFTYHHWLVADQKWLSGNEDDAQKVAEVLEQAAQKTEDAPDLAAEATQEAVNVKAEDTLEAVQEIDFEVKNLDEDSVSFTQEFIDFYIKIGTIKDEPDLSKTLLLGWYKG